MRRAVQALARQQGGALAESLSAAMHAQGCVRNVPAQGW